MWNITPSWQKVCKVPGWFTRIYGLHIQQKQQKSLSHSLPVSLQCLCNVVKAEWTWQGWMHWRTAAGWCVQPVGADHFESFDFNMYIRSKLCSHCNLCECQSEHDFMKEWVDIMAVKVKPFPEVIFWLDRISSVIYALLMGTSKEGGLRSKRKMEKRQVADLIS